MTDQNDSTATTARLFSDFTLDAPIRIGDQLVHDAGTKIQVRRPSAGELRGIDLSALIGKCDYTQVEKIAPRLTKPVLHKEHVAAMDPADFVQLGGEIVDFLLPKAVKQAASQTA